MSDYTPVKRAYSRKDTTRGAQNVPNRVSFIALHSLNSPHWLGDSNSKSGEAPQKAQSGCCQIIKLSRLSPAGNGLLDADADVVTHAFGEGNDQEFLLPGHGAPPAKDFELLDALDDLLLHFGASGQ